MEQRDRMISAFTEDPDVTIFLMSLKAGGACVQDARLPSCGTCHSRAPIPCRMSQFCACQLQPSA